MDESACNMWKCKCYVRFCIKDKLFTLDLYNFDIKVQSTNNQYFLAHIFSILIISNQPYPQWLIARPLRQSPSPLLDPVPQSIIPFSKHGLKIQDRLSVKLSTDLRCIKNCLNMWRWINVIELQIDLLIYVM